MKTKSIIILSLCSLMALGACDSKLDIPQKGVTAIEDFYQTDEDAAEALTAAYAGMNGVAGNYLFFKNLLADGLWSGGGNRNDNSGLEEIGEYTFTTTNGSISGYYQSLYTLIYRTNLIIKYFADGTSDTKKRAVAEAKVFRAYAYFELVTLWGTPPLITVPAENASEYTQPNGDPALIWGQIESDLTEAISSGMLVEKSGLDAVETRVTKQFAQAVLGKAYVFQNKFAQAASTLDEVIDSGKYDLYEGDFGDIMRASADFNREQLFEMNRPNDTSNPNAYFTFDNIMYGWRYDNLSDPSSTVLVFTGYKAGWGFLNPTEELFDTFEDWEGEDSYRRMQTMITYDEFKAKFTGADVATGKVLYGHEGYFNWKLRLIGADAITGGWASFHNNTRVMRFAEVLLLAAEAHLRSSTPDADKAKTYVNRIRTRAQLSDLPSVTLNDIKTEKQLELAFEGVRFQDLIRWGDAATVLANKGKSVPTFGHQDGGGFGVKEDAYTNSTYGFKVGKHELLPFPYTEIMVNPKITQNLGWE